MSTLAISASIAPDWIGRLDRALQAISDSARKVRVAVIRERAVVKFYSSVRQLNAHIAEFLSALDQGVRAVQSGELRLIDPGENVDVPNLILKMELCYHILSGLYTLATFAGLKRRALTKGEVKRLGDSAETVLDYIVWLKEAFSEDARAQAETIFSDGMRELEAGETVAFL